MPRQMRREFAGAIYALQEYGLTPKEMEIAEKRIQAELKTARARGDLTPFTGKGYLRNKR